MQLYKYTPALTWGAILSISQDIPLYPIGGKGETKEKTKSITEKSKVNWVGRM